VKKLLLILIFLLTLVQISLAQKDLTYLWPIEGTKVLTGAFGDQRRLHFHMGIDISTYEKTGYKVLACQSGWVYRVYSSWWGYGKGLYLKLNDGRYAVYGHLSDFAPKIKELAEKEQIKNKNYFLNLYLEPNWIRVERGELVGYSGETGLGDPHFHFEMRDQNDQPINPLTNGISVVDSQPPVFKKIILRLKGVDCWVDGEDSLAVLPFSYDKKKHLYTLEKIPIIWGKIGLAVSVFDQMDDRLFGIYKLLCYLDDELIFSSRYDTLNFDDTWMVDLDRDFEMTRKGEGNFYKLYVDNGNRLSLYSFGNAKDGLINTLDKDASFSKLHKVEIYAYDPSGNFSKARFDLLFDKKPEIEKMIITQSKDTFFVSGMISQNKLVKNLYGEISSLQNIKWEKKEKIEIKKTNEEYEFFLKLYETNPSLLRIYGEDSCGLRSDYKFLYLDSEDWGDRMVGAGFKPAPTNSELDKSSEWMKDYSFEDGYLTFVLRTYEILKREPKVWLQLDSMIKPVFLKQMDEKSYKVIFLFSNLDKKEVRLCLAGQDIYGDSVSLTEKIPLSFATEKKGGKTISDDGKAMVKLDPGLVFEDVNLRIEITKTPVRFRERISGDFYSFQPSNIPLAGLALVSLSYQGKEWDPTKLALYEYDSGFFRFVSKERDKENKMISGKVRYLSTYLLLEDRKAPQIRIISPKGKKIKDDLPKILVKISDDLSGFGSEEDIIVTLDGDWLIPEYDPEKNVLITKPNGKLSPGWHELLIKAKDRIGNSRVVVKKFEVIT
jgi:hypothetical protein